MGYLNDRLWKSAYLLEFKRNGIVTDAFTFSVPPQSEEFTYPQRINETKTFGGSVIDDYGNDIVKINLQGTTINQEVKIIYCSTKGMKYLDGEQEIFYLQSLIKEYGKVDKLSGKQVFLYQLNSGTKSFTNKWWEVYIQEFQIRRSKDAPMTYNYTISFLAQPEVKTRNLKLSNIAGWIQGIQTKIATCIENISKGLDYLNDWLESYQQIINLITTIEDAVEQVESVFSQYVGVLNNYISTTSDIFSETVSLGDETVKTATRMAVQYPLSVYNEFANLVTSCKSLETYIEDFSDNYDISNYVEQYGQTEQEIIDVWTGTAKEVTDNAMEMNYYATKLTSSVGYAILPGDSETDDTPILTCGYKEVTVQDNMSWDALALKYYGNADYGSIIASYNQGSELTVGETIQIPILGQSEIQNLDNEVLNSPDVKDNYGKDIELSSTNDFSVSNGDFGVIKSQNNLNQAVTNRLSCEVGSRVRSETYGIRASIGDATAASSFILSSIEQTLSEEPRIQSVDNISFVGKGDDIQVSIDYTDINDKKQTYGGTI